MNMTVPFRRPRGELGLAPNVRLHIAGEHVDGNNEMDVDIDVVNPPVPSEQPKSSFAERVRSSIQNHIVLREIGMSLYRVNLALQIWRGDRQYVQLNRDLDFHEQQIANAYEARIWVRLHNQQLRQQLRELGGQ
jgi:hypothetical protein